jgi:hypothetical protein
MRRMAPWGSVRPRRGARFARLIRRRRRTFWQACGPRRLRQQSELALVATQVVGRVLPRPAHLPPGPRPPQRHQCTEARPGLIGSTGTPTGIAMGHSPPEWAERTNLGGLTALSDLHRVSRFIERGSSARRLSTEGAWNDPGADGGRPLGDGLWRDLLRVGRGGGETEASLTAVAVMVPAQLPCGGAG